MTSIFLATDTSMATAGINTLIGMGTVFGSLILIIIIISLLKPFSDLITGGFKKKAKVVTNESKIAEQEVVATEVDMDNETELVAVITAAIMASYQDNNYTPDGLVVRKIRRLSR